MLRDDPEVLARFELYDYHVNVGQTPNRTSNAVQTGAQIYSATLPLAQRLYLTEVDADVEGDAFFPAINPDEWKQISERLPELTGIHSYRFLVLERQRMANTDGPR